MLPVWGGHWTEEKLETFEKYVKAYLKIMNKYRDRYNWILLYFDGFAGSGARTKEELLDETQSVQELFGNNVSSEELSVYKGAAERVIGIEQSGMRSFDKYYFVDKDSENCKALENKLSGYKVTGQKYFLPIDANEAIMKLSKTLTKYGNVKSLVFLDPFGMQIDWNSICSLNNLSVDLWILVPTGVIVNRLLERNFNIKNGFAHAEKLKSFFGMSQDEIKKYFYKETVVSNLFGEEETLIAKAEDSIRKIAELYVDRLRNVFPYVSEEPLVLTNNHNLPIYHLIFASKSKVAQKIAQQIINNHE